MHDPRASLMEKQPPVWFMTGCSTGFGRELARLVLDRGRRAVVTARDVTQIKDLTAAAGDRALAPPLDVTASDQITQAVASAEKHFGGIDVLVNNAGYGYQTSIEEGVESETRAVFDANVFGLFAMTPCRVTRHARAAKRPYPQYEFHLVA
jgi:NAD(P)-dependent dehydrogenase (short-subunit alcohol dehydrogenase family)